VFWIKLVHEQVAGKIRAQSTVQDVVILGASIELALTPEGMAVVCGASRTVRRPFFCIVVAKSTIRATGGKKLLFQFPYLPVGVDASESHPLHL
jgi:hypothetical protein